MDRWMDRWIDGWMDGWMERRKEGRIKRGKRGKRGRKRHIDQRKRKKIEWEETNRPPDRALEVR